MVAITKSQQPRLFLKKNRTPAYSAPSLTALVILVCFGHSTLSAAENITADQNSTIDHGPTNVPVVKNNWSDTLEIFDRKPLGFWSDLSREIVADNSAKNKFGSRSEWQWSRLTSRKNYGIHEAVADAGRDVFIDTMAHSFRETIANYLVSAYSVIVDSIGNTREEQLDFVGISPNATESEETLWRRTKNSLDLKYGIRPDYGYLSAGIGRLLDAHIFRIDLRMKFNVHSLSFNEDMAARFFRFEGRITFPLPFETKLVFGGRVYPAEFMYNDFKSREHGAAGSIRIERKIWSLGFSKSPRESLILGQITIPWDKFF